MTRKKQRAAERTEREVKRTNPTVNEALRDNGPGVEALAQAVWGKRGRR